MQSKHISLISFLLVIGAHVGGLAAVVLSPSAPTPAEIVMPTIQGALVMAEPEETPPPEPLPPPPPEKKPEPKPTPKPPAKAPPKAPASERAVKAPEPERPPPVEKPTEPQTVEPAPAPPVLPPRAVSGKKANPAPIYPQMSRRLREEGVVVLDILVKTDGTIGDIKIKISSGFKRLDDVAVRTVKRWHYEPATRAGVKIDFWYEQPVEFNLR